MNNNYIIISDEESLMLDKLLEIIKDFPSDDYDTIDLKYDNLSEVLLGLQTTSLFNIPKLVVIKDASLIDDIKEAIYEQLLSFLKAKSDNGLILIYKNKYNSKRFNELSKIIPVINLNNNKDYKTYINIYLNKEGYQIEEDALSYLLKYSYDLLGLKNICKTLMLYKKDNKFINLDDIKELLDKPLEDHIYDLVSAVVNRDREKAFIIYKDLKINKFEPTKIIALLASNFELLYNIYTLKKANFNKNQIAEILKEKPGRIYYLTKELDNYNYRSLQDILDSLHEVEYNIKSGTKNPELAFELYLLSI